MNPVETTLIYAGAPIAMTVLLYAGVYGRTLTHSARYRPGRPWTDQPVWYLPRAEATASLSRASSSQHLTGGPALVPGAAAGAPVDDTVGGASGEW